MSQDMSREQLSALMDAEGEYRGQSARTEATAAFIRHVASDEAARRDWLIYAQIGDVLRSADLTPMPGEADFLQRVSAAIAREPIVLQPQAVTQTAAAVDRSSASAHRSAAHRRPHWSTRMAAGMAAVAGVAVMAWVALPGLQNADSSGAAPTVASVGVLGSKGQIPVADTQIAAPLNPVARAGLIQADLSAQSPQRGEGGQGATQLVPVSEQMPMVEYLLAHQQMAGGMMPAVPATLQWVRNLPVEPSVPEPGLPERGLHQTAPAAQSH
jgi:sigma-E factor negative regulatory protein RseA